MDLFTIGFTQKSAEQFFELLKKHKIELLLDIRLNNKSQLAGFTKGSDLKYFLTQICECKYDHCIDCAPTKEILDAYNQKKRYLASVWVYLDATNGKAKASDCVECGLCEEACPQKLQIRHWLKQAVEVFE